MVEGGRIRTQRKVSIGFVVVCLIWGSTWLAIKLGLETVPPFLAAGLRFLLASIVLGGLVFLRNERLPRERGFRALVVFISLTSFSIPFALVYWGQHLIPSALASILFATFPFFVAVFSHIVLPNERISGPKMLGVLLGFIGVYVIFSSELSLGAGLAFGGMVAIVASSLIQAISLVFLKKHGESYSTLSINFVSIGMSAVLLLCTSVVVEDYTNVVFTPKAILSLLFLAIFGTVVTFVTYFWMIKHVQAVLLSMTSFVTPIIAVVLGALVMHEQLAPQIVSGAALVLGGILVANGRDLVKLISDRKSLLWD